MGRVHAINVSRGGVPKRPVLTARVGALGLEGDHQQDRKHHGGPDRAVSLWSLEVIEALALDGHPIHPGAAGENLTIADLDWHCIGSGTHLRIGEATLLEITTPAAPCTTIKHCFADGDYARISEKIYPGTSRWYARVLQEGWVSSGDAVTVVPAVGNKELP